MTKYDDLVTPINGRKSPRTPMLRIKTICEDGPETQFDTEVNAFIERVTEAGGQVQGLLLTSQPGFEFTAFVTYLATMEVK